MFGVSIKKSVIRYFVIGWWSFLVGTRGTAAGASCCSDLGGEQVEVLVRGVQQLLLNVLTEDAEHLRHALLFCAQVS